MLRKLGVHLAKPQRVTGREFLGSGRNMSKTGGFSDVGYLSRWANIHRNFGINDFIEDKKKQEEEKGEPGRGLDPDGQDSAKFDPFAEDDNSFYNQKKNTIYFFTAATITLAGVYFVMQVNKVRGNRKDTKTLSVSHVGKANIGGSWKLIDLEGKPFGSADLEGKYYLIYFGFANCPDVCPQTLYKITKALEAVNRVPEKKYFDLQTVFVTVDPDRDSKEAIQKFLRHYDKQIVPVTARSNNDPALRDMMNKFKIYASKIELEEEAPVPGKPTPYTLDHTIITYLMDDESQYLAHIGSNANPSDIAQLIVNKVMQNERDKLLR